MNLGGLQRFSLCDFPGRAAAVVFTQGCNFRCPFCHNGSLIPTDAAGALDEAELLAFLERRRGQLDGVVVSGGEPTLQSDLEEFLRRVKRLGFEVKLDTNGSRPDTLRRLLRQALVDYVAMDVKAPLAAYERLAGRPVDAAALRESIALIAGSGVAHEFRTTVVPELLADAELAALRAELPPGSPHRCQPFRAAAALDPALRQAEPARRAPAPEPQP